MEAAREIPFRQLCHFLCCSFARAFPPQWKALTVPSFRLKLLVALLSSTQRSFCHCTMILLIFANSARGCLPKSTMLMLQAVCWWSKIAQLLVFQTII